MTSLVVENEIIRLAALPQVGGKVISFFVKPVQKELLFQPKGPYRQPRVGDDFALYDTSGWDEMLPTIDPCLWEGKRLPDHGEIWAKSWEMNAEGNTLYGRVKCETIPLLFEREIQLGASRCLVSYTLTSLSEKEEPYLWAWHALWDMKGLSLEIPGITKVVPVHENTFVGPFEKPVAWPVVEGHDLRYPDSWQGEKSTKVYLSPDERISSATLVWPEVSLRVSWESEKIPYFGIWYNHGGFKGEYNVAIEPATGYYDRLDRAFRRGMVSLVPSHGVARWHLEIEVNV